MSPQAISRRGQYPSCSHIYMDELQWIAFESGDEPEVLTADLCAASGGCEKCPGFAKAGDVQPDHGDPESIVFCVHWVAPEARSLPIRAYGRLVPNWRST